MFRIITTTLYQDLREPVRKPSTFIVKYIGKWVCTSNTTIFI